MNISIKTALICTVAAFLLQGCATPKVSMTPEQRFMEGEQLFKKGDYEEAITAWKKVKESYQSPELTTKAELGIADAYFLRKEYIEAAAAYEDFRKLHPRHPKDDHVLYRQAMSYYLQITGIDVDQTPVKNAVGNFEKYLSSYPAGEHLEEVQAKYTDCRDKQFQYEIYIGRFYLKQDKYPAAIARFEQAIKKFNGLPHNAEALYYLGKAYLEAGQKPQARETLERLLNDFPASTYAQDAKGLMTKL